MRHSRQTVAETLDVTPSRVSQIAKSLNIKPTRDGYTNKDIAQMVNRYTKPGPRKVKKANNGL